MRVRLLAIVCFVVVGPGFARAQSIALPHLPNNPAAQAVIYYDGPPGPLAEGPLDARQILNLLGHFELRGEIVPIANYHPGDLARYQAAFFIGTASGTVFPAGFLEDVRNDSKPFAWVGRHVGQLLDRPAVQRQFGFAYADYRDDMEFREVEYKGVTLPKEDPDLNLVRVIDPSAAQVVATARNEDKSSYPYALHHDRFWYFADIPFSYAEEADRSLVFCDLLHDVLGIQHASSHLALVRLEDVSTDIDPADLREIADRLGRRNVPFQIAVIPIYRNPAQGIEVRLTDRSSFVSALQYAIAHGGTPIMHGVTHQYHGVTGDDFEFWNALDNRPVSGDSQEQVAQRLRLGLGEMFAAGIFPTAFETPHYAATETDYRALKTAFTVFNERTMNTPDLGSIQYFPYPVVDSFGRTIVPENLGYLPADKPDPQAIVSRARALRVVRDGVASFYFHPFLDPALLEQAVQGIASLGYQFVSLRQFGGAMNFQGHFAVSTSSGSVHLQLQNEFWRERIYDSAGRLIRDAHSPERLSASVDLPIEVPPGGWAAIEGAKELPAVTVSTSTPWWKERVAAWWKQAAVSAPLTSGPTIARSYSAWLLWDANATQADSNDQKSFLALLKTFGYSVRTVPVADFTSLPQEPGTILVIPQPAAGRMNEVQKNLMVRWIEQGGGLVADGAQPWLTRIGFEFTGHQIAVSNVVDVLFPERPLNWQREERVERFNAPENARQLMVDPESRQMLAVSGAYGRGSYLYLAAPLDEYTPDGISHFPYFADYMEETFTGRSSLRGARLEVYFDPAFRESTPLPRLVASWRQNGIRTVYAAAWEFSSLYHYDYDKLIQLAHQNGISVYAWLVLPQLNAQMWEDHPECRERTATGTDGKVGWRLLMNLRNGACFSMAMDWMTTVLKSADWDGVNVAELNFDADFENYMRADRFVPMNDDVRSEFMQQTGFDPALLFDPRSPHYRERDPRGWEQFLQYREDLVTDLHRRILQRLQPIQREHGWEVIVTMLDSLHSNYVRPALGVNSRRIAELMNEFDFTLQVEDPAEHWSEAPERYLRFAQSYKEIIPDQRRLMFDINVMPDRDVAATNLPSSLATGTELAEAARAAASVSGRVAIYSESTVASQDWELLSEALASGGELTAGPASWQVRAPAALLVSPAQSRNYYLDGQFWSGVTMDGVLVPPGEHRLSLQPPWYNFLDRGSLQPALLNLSADLLELHASAAGLSLSYRSPGRAVIALSQAPLDLYLDGRAARLSVQSGGGHWWVIAPRGEHKIEIVTASRTGVALNLWSWLSASAIAAFGAAASLAMAALYLSIRIRRLLVGRPA